MPSRRRAREIVLQLLYQHDLNHEQKPEVMQQFLKARLLQNHNLIQFARGLLSGTIENRKSIDVALASKAVNWTVKRMATIDRNILRLGAYELLYTDTPRQVVINEAIELAKRYGDRNSSGFVNGILDRILHSNQPDNPSEQDLILSN
jgi:transcription antitermination protein NusB